MTLSLLYCSVCGAANAPNDSACFACKRPLDLRIVEDEKINLLHNRYRILAQVGTGGFGAVYQAQDTQAQNRSVAIKQINLRGLAPQEIIEATDGFNREVQMLSALSHAHLPRIHTYFTDPDHWYVVMDFIEGETLEHYLRDITSADESAIRTLVLDEVLDIGLQLCRVLAYLHAHQPTIIFRDLKPANIMRTPQGRLYLIDFGIARYFKPGQARDTIPLGSPGYAAPEQYGRAQTTPRADIYSLGALLHHLFSRHDPSEAPFNFAPLHLADARGSRELAALIRRMVAQDVELRPGAIGEVESLLRQIRDQHAAEPRIWRPLPAGQVAPVPVLAKGAYQSPQVQRQIAAKRKARRKFLMGGLAVASTLALGGSIGGFSYWRSWHPARLTLEAGFPRQIPAPESAVASIAWSPNGQYVAFGLSDGSIVGSHLHTTNGFSLTPAFTLNPNTPGQPITVLAWSPDGRQLVAASQFGHGQLWNISTRTGQVLTIGDNQIQFAAWSPNGLDLAVIDGQQMLYVYHTRTGVVKQFATQNKLTGKALAWSPDGKRIVVELISAENNDYYSSNLQIWDSLAASRLASIFLSTAATQNLAWSPDGQDVAVLGPDGTLQVWDSQQKQVFSQQIYAQYNQLAWSPDNRFLAAIDGLNNLLLLDRSSGNTLLSVALTDPLGRGGIFSGKALTWLPDSQHIAIVNNDMECWLWSLSSF